jgi:5-hydroxyisourate hydrolase
MHMLGPRLSTHVLDTERGRPAPGVVVTLDRLTVAGAARVARATTDDGGRIADLVDGGLEPGTYRLIFDTGAYLVTQGHSRPFLNRLAVEFETEADAHHYHIPLLLAPFSATTYRGS